MSLLDNGPDVVTVYIEEDATDEYGNEIHTPSATPTTVRGRWQPSTVEDEATLGESSKGVYRFLTRTFPPGPFSRIEYDGASWDLIGPPRLHRGSPMTTHVTCYLRER